MSVKNVENLKKSFKNGLCTRCGTCAGLSEGGVVFRDLEGKYLPVQKGSISGSMADRIWAGCSAREIPFGELNHFLFGDEALKSGFFGCYKEIGVAFAADPLIRRSGASGGLLSSVLLWLLEKKLIRGAVVTRMSELMPWRPETFIATDRQEILGSAKSKYLITSVNQILPEIGRFKGDLAYVGLPCHVHSIRKLQMAKDPIVRNIRYVFGPFCGNTLHFDSVRILLRSYGYTDHREIASLSFREGEWPGETRIRMRDGNEIRLPKFHANYLIPFSIMKRCLVCTDLANELTDISGGDAWAPEYEERGKGFSLAIVRSGAGIELLDRMVRAGRIHFHPIEPSEAIAMHSHGYDLKKRGAYIRMRFRRLAGRDVPDYGGPVPRIPFTRYLMEIVISFLFWLCGTRPARWAVSEINPKVMGWMFRRARIIWKASTRNIKRRGLPDLGT